LSQKNERNYRKDFLACVNQLVHSNRKIIPVGADPHDYIFEDRVRADIGLTAYIWRVFGGYPFDVGIERAKDGGVSNRMWK
jgi:hypothetical protein